MRKYVQHAVHPRFAASGQAPQNWAANLHGAGAHGQRAQNVNAAANSAVDNNWTAIRHRAHNGGQGVGRWRGAIKLSATMIAHHHRRRAIVKRATCVVGAQNSLDHHWNIHGLANDIKVLPCQRRVNGPT